MIQLTRFTSTSGLLTKKVQLDAGGKVVKTPAAELIDGTAETLAIDFNDFGGLLTSLETNQAISFGVPACTSARVMSESRWKREGQPAGVTLRKRSHFSWPAGSGVLMLDYDAPGSGETLTRTELLAALYAAMPELKDAAHWCWSSASSCIWNGDVEIVGVRGQRVYVLVSDASEIPHVGELLANRLWLAGRGYFKVSESGSLLERTLVDTSVWQPERLDFAAGAACSPPLDQRRGVPIRLGGALPLDVRAISGPTREEAATIEKGKAEKRQAAKPLADAARSAWIEARGKAIHEKRGVPIEEATRMARCAVGGRLYGAFPLTTQDGESVFVADLLANRERWHGTRFYDPLDSECDDPRVAWANLEAARPYIWSHAHGGARYALHRTRETIEVGDGITAEATEAALKYMREDGSYYVRGGVCVRADESGRMQPLDAQGLRHNLDMSIRFEKFKAREKRTCPTDCPLDIPQRLLSGLGSASLPQLCGVSLWPTVTVSGRLLDRPGYDAETSILFVEHPGSTWPTIPREPTAAEVLAALQTVWAPVALFPYTDDISRGVTLAAIITAAIRKTLPTAPGFLFAAPSAGTGKTLLAECLVELAGGGAAIALPDSEAEISKTLTAKLRAGASALFFDNITKGINSPSLDAMLTTPFFDGRILGVSEMTGPLPTNALIIITGNNAAPVGDSCRRILTATIDARIEAPYSRRFDFNPLTHIRDHKADIVGAVLTLLQGFIQAGKPRSAANGFASFDDWERLVRQCVLWLGAIDRAQVGAGIGFGDPIAGIEAQYAADEETAALHAVVSEMEAEQDGLGFLGGELFKRIEIARRLDTHNADSVGLGAALLNAMPQVQSAKGVGRWLKRLQGRVVNGRRIVGRPDPITKTTRWRVER